MSASAEPAAAPQPAPAPSLRPQRSARSTAARSSAARSTAARSTSSAALAPAGAVPEEKKHGAAGSYPWSGPSPIFFESFEQFRTWWNREAAVGQGVFAWHWEKEELRQPDDDAEEAVGDEKAQALLGEAVGEELDDISLDEGTVAPAAVVRAPASSAGDTLHVAANAGLAGLTTLSMRVTLADRDVIRKWLSGHAIPRPEM